MIGATVGSSRVPVTVVVLTFNESRNLAACLESVREWSAATFVVDSGSTDDTLDIARASGAQIATHAFETHSAQWAWALSNLPIATSWVLGLDADQRVTPELARDLASTLTQASAGANAPTGYFVARRQVFRGRWIKHGGYYPKYLLKLFRREHVRIDAADLVDHHFSVDGPVAQLSGDIVEDNRNEADIAVWTAKHNRYAVLQARQEVAARRQRKSVPLSAVFGSPDDRTRWMKSVWASQPLFVRPCAYVFYRYIVRLGFLDGKEGFIFHVLQAFWYRLLVDINIDEIESQGDRA